MTSWNKVIVSLRNDSLISFYHPISWGGREKWRRKACARAENRLIVEKGATKTEGTETGGAFADRNESWKALAPRRHLSTLILWHFSIFLSFSHYFILFFSFSPSLSSSTKSQGYLSAYPFCLLMSFSFSHDHVIAVFHIAWSGRGRFNNAIVGFLQ